MDWALLREWASRSAGAEPPSVNSVYWYRDRLIECAEIAVAEHERAEAAEARAKGYWWCPRCETEAQQFLGSGHRHECGTPCQWYEPGFMHLADTSPPEPEPPAETPAAVKPAPDPLAVDLRAAGRVYRRALVAIREVERIQEAIGKGYPRPAASAADIARRLRLFARSVATDLGDDFELVERKSAELEIEHREQADVWERESTAAMLERLLPGEAGAILSCLVRGCFQHWSPDDGIPEDLSFTDD